MVASDNRTTGKQFTRTSLRNGGRIAGMGMAYDDYSEESFESGRCHEWERVRFSTDGVKPEELNGPVIIVQAAKKKNT